MWNAISAGFELASPCPIPATITITSRPPPLVDYAWLFIRLYLYMCVGIQHFKFDIVTGPGERKLNINLLNFVYNWPGVTSNSSGRSLIYIYIMGVDQQSEWMYTAGQLKSKSPESIGLVSLFLWHINLRGLFNVKAILIEEQQVYYLI